MDKFNILAESIKVAKVQIEKAQYDVEQARSTYLALERQGKACEGHVVTIENLKKELAEAKVRTENAVKDSNVMVSKLKQFQSLLNS